MPVYIDGQSGRLADLGGKPTKIGLLVVDRGTPLKPEGSSTMLAAGPALSKPGDVVTSQLPNDDPWTWLRAWDAGQPGLSEPPEPGAALWIESAARQFGTIRSTIERDPLAVHVIRFR